MIHEIPLEEGTVHGYFSSALAPVAAIDPGDSVRFQSLNAGWRWDASEERFERDKELHSGHALTGPIEVRGARAGATLAVAIDEVVPGDWGVTFGDGDPFHWTIDGDTATNDRGSTVSLAPFMGVIGMPPPEPGIHSTGPPRRFGGNIDCKLLVAGTTLYLPVPVDGDWWIAEDLVCFRYRGDAYGLNYCWMVYRSGSQYEFFIPDDGAAGAVRAYTTDVREGNREHLPLTPPPPRRRGRRCARRTGNRRGTCLRVRDSRACRRHRTLPLRRPHKCRGMASRRP